MTEIGTRNPLSLFADHAVDSVLPLRNLLPAPSPWGGPLIRIHNVAPVARLPVFDSWLFTWDDGDGGATMRVRREQESYRLRMYEMCDFLIDVEGCDLAVEHLPHVDADAIEHMLIDQALPRLLSERGDLVVHAGAVCVDDECILFLGDSGWGKSTLVASFMQRGHALLSDDCVVLDVAQSGVHALPTYPSLRMFEDSMAQALGGSVVGRPIAFYTSKQRVALADDVAAPARSVRAIYVLNDPAADADGTTIAALPPMDACMAIIRHGFRLDVASPAQHRAQLQQASAAASRLRVFALSYPRVYERRDALVDTLLAHSRSR